MPPSAKERSATDQGLDSVVPVPPPSDGGNGGIARGTDKRLVDATAQLTLGADRSEVQDVANDVVGVTDRHQGVVLDSQISDDKKNARADFQLEIPYNQLDAALTDLSELGDVLSRNQAGHDITAAAVRTRRDLAGVYDRIRKARAELIRADTTEQKQLIKARIQSLNASADALQTKLAGVQRQARFATVSVTVTSDRPNGSGGGSADDGNWTVGEALDDAADILQAIAGRRPDHPRRARADRPHRHPLLAHRHPRPRPPPRAGARRLKSAAGRTPPPGGGGVPLGRRRAPAVADCQ